MPVPGEEFHGYVVGSLAGRGGTAQVYLAHRIDDGFEVALKVLEPRHRKPENIDRLHREFDLAQRFSHPRIVTVFEHGGTAATFHDMADGARYDLMIAGISALCLIFLIMLLITRSFVASLVIVGTVLLSLGASFGLSVIIWQYILGKELHWMVMQMAIIVLLAVGSDYNLLLVSRLKEELPGGLKTGMIRAMGGTGSVVTSAGLVFAFTMMAMAISDLTIIGQVGTTIGLGLLFDTLVVRSFMTPAIATILGRWFWWPLNVRTRPLPPPRTPQPDTTPPPPAPAPVGAGPDPATTEFPRPSY
ncbi:Probable membrane protein, MmpL [Mycobacteroides abscessus subsp. abscessus]|nr:Probable membrane protein, MmpL [Mycobacteroides abscessus subsp. abscessus]